MQDSIYKHVVEEFCFENFYFENIRIEHSNGMFKSIQRDYDLIVFNAKKIIFFAHIPSDTGRSEVVVKLREALNSIVSKLSRSLNDFIVCGASEDTFYVLNKYNNQLLVFDRNSDEAFQLIEYIENELTYGSDNFNYNALRELSDFLLVSSSTKELSKTKDKVKILADGRTCVKKHGTWFEASEVDTEMLYALAAFGGMFGLHLFYLQKRAKGVLYFFTLGLCGIGWFFDSIEILFGIYRDREGKYLLPVENKISGLIMLLIGAVIFGVVSFVLLFLFKFIFETLSENILASL